MQEVEAICDRVIIINKGRIVADDDTRVLQRKLTGERVFVIQFDREVRRQDLEAVPGVATATFEGDRWRIRSKNQADIREALFKYAVAGGFTVLKLDMEEHSLEEVFHSLTRS
jgi:ABC-2 type transport system ATP-binding protein